MGDEVYSCKVDGQSVKVFRRGRIHHRGFPMINRVETLGMSAYSNIRIFDKMVIINMSAK